MQPLSSGRSSYGAEVLLARLVRVEYAALVLVQIGLIAAAAPGRSSSIIEQTKQTWHAFKAGDPGHRFQDQYDRRQHAEHGRRPARSVGIAVLGLAVAIAGLLLVLAPGPGWIITFLGLGLLGGEFAPIARALDWTELKGRVVAGWARGVWNRSSPAVKALLVLLAVGCLAALGYAAYRLLAGARLLMTKETDQLIPQSRSVSRL